MSKWPWHCTCIIQANMVPMNLVWSESSRRLPSSSIRKILGGHITPMGTPTWARWANDHDVAHLQATRFQLIWFGANLPSGCGVPAHEYVPFTGFHSSRHIYMRHELIKFNVLHWLPLWEDQSKSKTKWMMTVVPYVTMVSSNVCGLIYYHRQSKFKDVTIISKLTCWKWHPEKRKLVMKFAIKHD